jgi:hypothetical protein
LGEVREEQVLHDDLPVVVIGLGVAIIAVTTATMAEMRR